VSKAVHNIDAFCFLDKKQLVKLKTKAIRSGAWFKALQRIDRVLFDLIIRVVGTIRSARLARSIAVVARKLEGVMSSSFSSSLRKMGLPLAQKISLAAQKLGNISASSWALDSSFAFFLAVMHINNAKTLKQ
jgi:hypothetical protein